MQGNIKRAKRAAAYAARAEKTGDRDGDSEFLRQIRDAVTAARHADLAFFEGGISLGDLMRAFEKQGLDKKVVKSEVIQRFGLYQSPNVLFRVHCRDLVDIIFKTRDAAAIAEEAVKFALGQRIRAYWPDTDIWLPAVVGDACSGGTFKFFLDFNGKESVVPSSYIQRRQMAIPQQFTTSAPTTLPQLPRWKCMAFRN